jgi:hypothetical protein
MKQLIKRAEQKSPVDREIFAILLAKHLGNKPIDEDALNKPLDQLLREAAIEDGYIEEAAKVVNTFLKEPGDFRSEILETVRDRRHWAEVGRIQRAVRDHMVAKDKAKAMRAMIERVEKQEGSARDEAASELVLALVYIGKDLEYIDYAEQVVNTFFKEPSDQRTRLLDYLAGQRLKIESPKEEK